MTARDTLNLAIVTTTVASAGEAQRLATQAVQRRLAACVQVEPVTSHYGWEGRLCEEAEWRLSCKTPAPAAVRLRAWLRSQHPYAVPQLLTHTVQAEPDYLQWAMQQVDT